MPLKSGVFTPQERAFVQHMAHSNNPTLAAREAGYAQPSSRGGVLMRRQDVVARVQAAVAHRLRTEGAEVGVGTLIEIAQDPKFPAASRVMAARELVKLSGVAADTDETEKPLHTMTRGELAAAADKARAYIEELDAPVIDHEELPEVGGVFD